MIVVDEVVMLFILVSKQEIFAGKKWNLTFKAMIKIWRTILEFDWTEQVSFFDTVYLIYDKIFANDFYGFNELKLVGILQKKNRIKKAKFI